MQNSPRWEQSLCHPLFTCIGILHSQSPLKEAEAGSAPFSRDVKEKGCRVRDLLAFTVDAGCSLGLPVQHHDLLSPVCTAHVHQGCGPETWALEPGLLASALSLAHDWTGVVMPGMPVGSARRLSVSSSTARTLSPGAAKTC